MAEGLIVQTEGPNPRSEQALTRGVVVPGRALVLLAVEEKLLTLLCGRFWVPCLRQEGVLGFVVQEGVLYGACDGFPEVVRCQLQIGSEEVDRLAHLSMWASSTSE